MIVNLTDKMIFGIRIILFYKIIEGIIFNLIHPAYLQIRVVSLLLSPFNILRSDYLIIRIGTIRFSLSKTMKWSAMLSLPKRLRP